MIVDVLVFAALSDGQWAAIAAVGVGLLAAVASVVTALIGLANKRAMGTPNGHGDLATMMAKLLDGQTGQDTRLAVIERRQIEQAERLTQVEHTQQTFCASVHGIEVAVDALPHHND